MFLQVRWPNQQCQSTEVGWLVIQIALNLTRLISPCYNNTTAAGERTRREKEMKQKGEHLNSHCKLLPMLLWKEPKILSRTNFGVVTLLHWAHGRRREHHWIETRLPWPYIIDGSMTGDISFDIDLGSFPEYLGRLRRRVPNDSQTTNPHSTTSICSAWTCITSWGIGVNFYMAARLKPPPPLFRLQGFQAFEPFSTCVFSKRRIK